MGGAASFNDSSARVVLYPTPQPVADKKVSEETKTRTTTSHEAITSHLSFGEISRIVISGSASITSFGSFRQMSPNARDTARYTFDCKENQLRTQNMTNSLPSSGLYTRQHPRYVMSPPLLSMRSRSLGASGWWSGASSVTLPSRPLVFF